MILDFIFTHRFLFCMLFAALAGVVHELDSEPNISFRLIRRAIISGTSGILFFFLSFDYAFFTPAKQLGGALVIGYCGSYIFERIALKYQMLKGSPEVDVVLSEQYADEPAAFLVDSSVTADELSTGVFDITEDEKEELLGDDDLTKQSLGNPTYEDDDNNLLG